MQYTKITRKQAGVIYRAIKENKVVMESDLVGFMYDRADAHMSYNACDDAVEAHILNAVDAVFAQDLARAQECIDAAWGLYKAIHGLGKTEEEEEPEDDMTVTTEIPATMVEGEATATSGSWTPDDSTVDTLTVTEEECDHDLTCFVVTMVRDGETREQVIHPFSLCAVGPIRSDLDQGESPIGWDDGLGRMVCWENAAPVGGEE